MATIDRWLNEIGLGELAQVFADNAIDETVLDDLTDEDLKEMGVVLGNRKKLLKAISARKAERSVRPESVRSSALAASSAERRQLTVVFCDLVGSTEMSSSLDAEDLRTLIYAYQDACSAAIERYDGHIAQYLGDGIVAYFGYPRAYEDSAERAVRASLDMIEAVRNLNLSRKLEVRIGMATGLSVVGDRIGEGTQAAQHAVVGQAPNLAARIQALAEPGSIAISQATHKLVGHLFECADLGTFSLKGIPGDTRAYRIVGGRAIKSRFEARKGQTTSLLIGRERELSKVRELWNLSKQQNGQVAVLIGEAGIGKSRLIQAFRQSLSDEPHETAQFQCLAHYGNSPLHPVLVQLRDAAGVDERATPGEKLRALEEHLAAVGMPGELDARLMAALLSIPTEEKYLPLQLSPAKQKELTIACLGRYFRSAAARRPAALFFEDIHWIDPSSLEALEELVTVAQESRMLVVVSHRSDVKSPWSAAPHVTSFHLQRLEAGGARVIIDGLGGGKAFPAEVVDLVVQKSEGIPLFLEELTKSVLESGVLREEADHFSLERPLSELAIPETLQASLMARLDRLSGVKHVAQIAAALGRQFSYPLIAGVAGLDASTLDDALARMIDSGLVFSVGSGADATYFFKHALIQEAAYEMLLRDRRQKLHARIAEVLKTSFPAMIEDSPELLAHHLILAGSTSEAIAALEKAGTKALATSANVEAIALFERALDLLFALPEGVERERRKLGLLVLLGRAMIAGRGYAAPETHATLLAAKALFDDATPPALKLAVLYGISACYYVGGDVPRMEEAAHALLAFGDEQNDSGARCLGHRLVGSCQFAKGNFREALDWLARGELLYDPEKHPAMVSQYGQDIGVSILCYQAMAHWMMGNVEEADRREREALRRARELKHPLTLGYTLGHLTSMLGVCRRAAEEVADKARETVSFCHEAGLTFWKVSGVISVGWAEVLTGREEEGRAKLSAGIQGWIKSGARTWLPTWLCLQAECELLSGDVASARDLVARALDQAAKNGERWSVPEILRMQGKVELEAGDVSAAEKCLLESIALARSQEARSWELRSSEDLARLKATGER